MEDELRATLELVQVRVLEALGGQPRTRGFWARRIEVHHSYHAGQLFTLGALIRGGL